MSLNNRLARLEQAAGPNGARLDSLPPRLRALVRDQEDWVVLRPLAGGDWYARPKEPFNYEHAIEGMDGSLGPVPVGAERLTAEDIETLTGAGVQTIRIEYVKDWRGV